MKAAIIGCGFIGQKRARTLGDDCQLIACVDQVQEKAENLAKQYPGCEAYTDWREVINRPSIDIVLICTLHATLAEIALAAAEAGKHLLIEKPAGRRAAELDAVVAASKKNGCTCTRWI